MKCMNVMQCNSLRKKKKHKNQRQRTMATKGKNNEAQGPCQKDSVRLSLLHPNVLDTPRALEFVFTLE